MKERPICAVDGCNNYASWNYGGKWVCGECMNKWHLENQKKAFDEFEEFNNGKRDMS